MGLPLQLDMFQVSQPLLCEPLGTSPLLKEPPGFLRSHLSSHHDPGLPLPAPFVPYTLLHADVPGSVVL